MPSVYVETREVPLGELMPFPGNAKHGDVGVIRESIRRNGQYRSLVVRDTNESLIILAGNHTYMALKANGDKTARCEIIRCDDDTSRRINLVDNRAADKGSYDNDELLELLSYLDGDYEGTGYTGADVDLMIEPMIPEFEEPPVSSPGRFDVLIICFDENEQSDTVTRLTENGYTVRIP